MFLEGEGWAGWARHGILRHVERSVRFLGRCLSVWTAGRTDRGQMFDTFVKGTVTAGKPSNMNL